MSRGGLFVLAAALLWGTTGTASALAPEVGALAIGAAAMGVGGLLQALVALPEIRRSRTPLAAHRRLVAVSAAAVAVYPLAFYSSMRLSGVAIGTVVTIASAPIAAALIEWRRDGRPPSRRWAMGAVIGVFGVALPALAPHAAAGGHGVNALAGVGLGVLAGTTYAVYTWGAARIMKSGIGSRPVMGTVFGLAGLLLLPVLFASGTPILGSVQNLTATAYLAVVPMFLGYVLFGAGLRTVSATSATTLSLIEPAAAALCAMAILGEQISAPGWIGVVLLTVSIVVMTWPGGAFRTRSTDRISRRYGRSRKPPRETVRAPSAPPRPSMSVVPGR